LRSKLTVTKELFNKHQKAWNIESDYQVMTTPKEERREMIVKGY
jgi:hypothetical protein